MMFLMKFASGLSDSWKFDSLDEADEIAKMLLCKYDEKFVIMYHKGKIYKTFYKEQNNLILRAFEKGKER